MKRIVIVGAGYAGLECAITLERKLGPGEAHVTLINKHDYHYASTLLHRVSLGTYSARKARVFIRNVIDESKIHFVKDIIEHIDFETKRVEGRLGCYEYDYLVLAAGFEGNTFGLPGVEEYAYQITSMNTAEKLLHDTEIKFKDYSYAPDPKKLKFAVVGAGFTGVEYAAELVDRAQELCKICGIDYSRVSITLIGRREAILPMMGDKGAEIAKKKILDLGVKFVVGNAEEVTPDGVIIEHNGERELIEAGTVLWSAGVKGNSLVSASGLPNKKNRVDTDQFLHAPGYENVYIAGDCAAFTGEGEQWPYTATGQIAQQMGHYLGERLAAEVAGRPFTKPFVYHYRGTVCSIGHLDAVAIVNGITLTGELAAFMKNFIENKWLFGLGGTKLVMKKGQFRSRTSD